MIKYPLVLDGGFSNQLEQFGCDLNQSLWTARALITDHNSIVKSHLAYLEAGAQCIITSSYQASIPGFEQMGLNENEARELILFSVELALKAVNIYLESNPQEFRPLVAASIGPYGAFLSDGSEYHGNYGVSDELLHQFHQSKIQLLDDSSADLLAIETIPSYQEALVLSEILKDVRKDAWISFSCKDDRCISDDTPIKQCVELFNDLSNVFAVGVNCTFPKYISGLIKRIKETAVDKKIIVYPNSGEIFDANTKTWLTTSKTSDLSLMANEWLQLGADIIGGCCRIGPKEIEAICKSINGGEKQ